MTCGIPLSVSSSIGRPENSTAAGPTVDSGLTELKSRRLMCVPVTTISTIAASPLSPITAVSYAIAHRGRANAAHSPMATVGARSRGAQLGYVITFPPANALASYSIVGR